MSSPPPSSAAVNGEEPSAKKQKKNPSSLILPQTLFSSFPDDLVVSCLARVSRLHYQTLSFVSKRFQSLVVSSELHGTQLYQTRSLLHRKESCLYVCLRFPLDPNPNPRWFTLCRRPNRTNNNNGKKSICNLLVSIPSSPYPPAQCSGLVAVGSRIYNIGGTIKDEPSSRVSILDCRSHKWDMAPSMLMKRDHPAASVLDGKIYVAGGCKDIDSPNWLEFFDPKLKTWKPVSSPCAKKCDSEIIVSTEIDGKVYMCGHKGVAYNPKDGNCETVEWNMCKGWTWFSYCVIDNVLYYYYDGEFKWFDTSIRGWRIIKGLKELKFASYSHVKLADYGGKMAVLWDMNAGDSGFQGKKIWCAEIAIERCNTGDSGFQGKKIWCAEIAIKRSNTGEISGKVELVDAVLEIPNSYEFVRVLAVTV